MEGRQGRAQASVLLVTADQDLEREVRRVASGVAAVLTVVAPREVVSDWHDAQVVLVGGDCAASMARRCLPRRDGVSIVTRGQAQSEAYRSALELGATRVLELTSTHDWIVEVIAESVAGEITDGRIVGFLSAAGGSGASTFAVSTACLGAERMGTVLVDLDPLGMGVERLIGYDGGSVTTWETLGDRPVGARAFRDSLPVHAGVHIVGFGGSAPGDLAAVAVGSVLSACPRAFDLTVVDLPRSLDAATLEAIGRCDLVVVCCPQSTGAVLAGRTLLASLPDASPLVALTRAGTRRVEAVAVADSLEIPLLESVSDQRGLDEVLAAWRTPLRSRGPGLRQAAAAVLDSLDLGP